MSEVEVVELSDRADWRRWLREHHTRSSGVWLVTRKKSAGKPRLDYDAAVEEALCYGWVDSKSRSVDEERTSRIAQAGAWLTCDVDEQRTSHTARVDEAGAC